MKFDDDGPIVGGKPPLSERIFKHFNLRRGVIGFLIGLALAPIYILINYDWNEDFHWDGAILLSLIFASVAGLWGLFSKKDIPL